MIELTEDDIRIIKDIATPRLVTLSTGSYLVKQDYDNKAINEIIGKMIADIMNLKCPKYFITTAAGTIHILSEDINKYGEFTSSYNLNADKKDHVSYSMADLYYDEDYYDEETKKDLQGNSLYDIWPYLENNYDSDTSKRLMKDVIKMYIFDILFLNFDRRLGNWGILKYPNNQVDIVMFDNEYILDQSSSRASTVEMQTDFLAYGPNTYQDLTTFVHESSKEYLNLFLHYIRLFTKSFLNTIISAAEETSGCQLENKENCLKLYETHREKLIAILNEELSKEGHHGR